MFWTMKKAGYRAVQVGLGLAMRVIPWQKPVLVEHPGRSAPCQQRWRRTGCTRCWS